MRKPVATLGHVRGRGPEEMPGGHAGLTREEIRVPLIVVERKQEEAATTINKEAGA